MTRMSKDFYYLSIAEAVSKRSTCITKQYGAIIVSDDRIVSTGYNGAPRGCDNCCDSGECIRLQRKEKRGTNYADGCVSVHGEQNAILSAPFSLMHHATLYLYGYDMLRRAIVKNPDCCAICKRLIINSGIETVIIADPDVGIPSADLSCPYRAKIIKVEDWKNANAIVAAY